MLLLLLQHILHVQLPYNTTVHLNFSTPTLPSLYLFLSVSSLYLFVPLSGCFYLSVSACCFLSLCVSFSVSISLAVCLSPSLCLCVSKSFSFLFLSPTIPSPLSLSLFSLLPPPFPHPAQPSQLKPTSVVTNTKGSLLFQVYSLLEQGGSDQRHSVDNKYLWENASPGSGRDACGLETNPSNASRFERSTPETHYHKNPLCLSIVFTLQSFVDSESIVDARKTLQIIQSYMLG